MQQSNSTHEIRFVIRIYIILVNSAKWKGDLKLYDPCVLFLLAKFIQLSMNATVRFPRLGFA